MNKNEHLAIFKQDYLEGAGLIKHASVFLKLIYYSLQRPAADFFIRKKLKNYSVPEQILNYVNLFLNNEGGMFKSYIYKLCNRFSPLKNSSVLIPGIGYGRNLFQVAARRPKKIVAFDLYEYSEEWEYLQKEFKEKFGVESIFLKGGFEALDRNWLNSFDFIITEAVLEHTKDIPRFLADSRNFLKNRGIFYASFGPLWWGPGGDHLDWGEKELFNQILLSEDEYRKRFNEKFGTEKLTDDSAEGAFLVDKKLFSFLKVDDYLNNLREAGFKKELAYAKISQKAFSLMEENPNLFSELNNKNVPIFDKFCGGLFLWLRLNK